MDLASVDVDGHRVDVPFRVFTPDYYPCLHALYTHLGIATASADYSLCFTRPDGSTLWSYTNLTLGDVQVPIPDCVHKEDRLAIVRDWTRLLFASACAVRSPRELRLGGRLDTPVAEYLALHRYEHVFTTGVLLPFLASVFTCSVAAAAEYPANAVLHFVAKAAFGARLRKARGGVSEVCRRLLDGNKEKEEGSIAVHYNATVARITPDLHVMLEGQGEEPLAAFDAVVVATPADAAARLVAEAAPNLSRALSAISYEDARVVTHRDAAAVMPQHQGDWRGVNIMSTVGGDGCGGGRAMASHWLNYVEATSTARAFATPLFQTVDPRRDIDPADIARASAFHRSLLSVDSQHAVDDIHRLQGARGGRVWV
ncbi:hypothetical protein GGI21_006255, partial [Coemansia aciculifera]